MATREAELFKDKIEVVLDGRQIFYLFFGGAVIACLVFILGVTVGRRVEARANPPRAAGAAHDPLAALDELDAEGGGEMAFPAALRGGADRPLGAVDARLAKGGAPTGEPVEPATPTPPAAILGAPVLAASAPAPAAAGPATPTARPPAKEVAPAKAPPAEPVASKASGSYTLQLSSFQDKAEAEAFVASVKTSGYAPYIVKAEVEGKGTWYRIRVGDYGSFDAAVAAKAEFEAKQKIIAYVTRLK